MHWAVRAGAMECTGILLRHGVSVDALNAAQRTFLQRAADRDQIETVQLLAWSGAELNTRTRRAGPPCPSDIRWSGRHSGAPSITGGRSEHIEQKR